MAYDIFISYRRRGAGAGVAGELQAKLENRGLNAFLDVDEIGSGHFPAQIQQAIEECKDFILVLAPGTLDHCVEEGDWVRREIEEAERLGKNIIGVALSGFVMPSPDELPASLRDLSLRQVFLWTHEYRTASFEKIVENLISTKVKKKRKRRIRIVLLSLFFSVLLAGGLYFMMKKPIAPHNNLVVHPTTEQFDAAQLFNSHVGKAQDLTRNLPDVEEVNSNFQQYVSQKETFEKLMAGIAEYDSAIMLKNEYGNAIIDTFDMGANRDALLNLREVFMNGFVANINGMLQSKYIDFARDDLKMARILEFPSDKPKLDSLEIVITQLSIK